MRVCTTCEPTRRLAFFSHVAIEAVMQMEIPESVEEPTSPQDQGARQKDKKDKKEKKERGKKEKKKKREAKPRRGLGALVEGSSGDLTQSRHNIQDDVERGLTQEQILQLQTLDTDDDADDLNRIYYTSHLLAAHAPLCTKNYVENEISGEFFRVRSQLKPRPNKLISTSKQSLRRLQHRHQHQIDGNGGEEDGLRSGIFGAFTSRRLMDMEVAVMLLGHGIVVGLSWMDSFNLGVSQDRLIHDAGVRVQFVCTYSGLANRSRQLFFLLFNLILLGLMRKISRLRLQPEADDMQIKSLRLVQGSMVFTVISLLVLLVESPSAVWLSNAFTKNPSWCDQVADTGSVQSSTALTRHQQCAITNAVLLSVGFLLVCIESTLGISSNASLRRRLATAHKAMDDLDQRNDHLEGKNLDELSIDALKELIQLHQRAVESTEGVLVTKLQIRNPTASLSSTPTWGTR